MAYRPQTLKDKKAAIQGQHAVEINSNELRAAIEANNAEQKAKRKKQKASIGSGATTGCVIESGKFIAYMTAAAVVGWNTAAPGNEVAVAAMATAATAGLRSLYLVAKSLGFKASDLLPSGEHRHVDQVERIQKEKKRQGGNFGPKY